MIPVKGWRAADATTPKPIHACRCRSQEWVWYRPESRWICGGCGAYPLRQASNSHKDESLRLAGLARSSLRDSGVIAPTSRLTTHVSASADDATSQPDAKLDKRIDAPGAVGITRFRVDPVENAPAEK